MSADNGVYILETLAENGHYHEYRVAHLCAIDNVNWSEEYSVLMRLDDVRIKNARKMWKDCKAFTNEADAFSEARKIEKSQSWTEYGIVIVVIDRVF